MIIRALIPSWRFFSEVGDTPRLYIQILAQENRPLSDWKLHSSFQPRETPPRSFGQLFYNPEDNKRMALRGIVMRALEELKADEPNADFLNGFNYQLLRQMCVDELGRSIDINAPLFRFKIVVDKKDASDSFEVFTSVPLELRPKATV